tara:strand:- start:5325 stop:6119 length:795 start_codon:yes stop_codon:yes gene_type:complete
MSNNGERGERRVILEFVNHRNDTSWLASHFGDETVDEGIEVINPTTNHIITNREEIRNAPSHIKADMKIKIKRTQREIGVSIKYFHKSNPCIVNCTSREKFIRNERLRPYVPTLDVLIGQYQQDPSNLTENKSEVDRMLSDYNLTMEQRREIAVVIAYFTLEGTGRGDATVPANAVCDMYHNTGEIVFREMITDEEKIQYVLDNWHRYVLSIRGVHEKRNGQLRGNGMSTVNPPTEEQLPWVCMYNDNGVMRPRGAISIRIKKR